MCCDDVQQHFLLFVGLCHCNFSRQIEVILADYAVLDQSVAAFGDLLFELFGVFQTIWISNRDGAGEPVRQFDFAQLPLDGLAQVDLVDVAQDEHRLDDLADSLHRLIDAVLVRVGIQATEDARCGCFFQFDRNNQAQQVIPAFENYPLVDVFLWCNHPVSTFVLAVAEVVKGLFL